MCEHKNLTWRITAGDGRGRNNIVGNGFLTDNAITSVTHLRGSIEVKCRQCGAGLRQPFGIPAAGVIGQMIRATAANLRDVDGRQHVVVVEED